MPVDVQTLFSQLAPAVQCQKGVHNIGMPTARHGACADLLRVSAAVRGAFVVIVSCKVPNARTLGGVQVFMSPTPAHRGVYFTAAWGCN